MNGRIELWHKQELFKGRNIFYGTGWAGWGFESNAVASAANAAPDAVLRFAPIFEHDPSGMFSSSIPKALQNHILAKGIPALSQPVGRTEMSKFSRYDGTRNFDMNEMKPEGWCRKHDKYGMQWLHSDIQNAGYFYTHEVFESFVENGDLK